MIKARNEALLVAFGRYKSTLLNSLRIASEHGTSTRPSEAEKSWANLTRIALFHIKFERSRARAAEPRHAKPLDDLAKALKQACELTRAAMMESGRHAALVNAWRNETKMMLASARVFESGSTRILEELTAAVQTLARLAAMASRAANDARPKGGRPKGPSKLPGPGVIIGLAGVYRRATGLKPTTTKDGLFFKFTRKCLFALGYRDINPSSLVSVLKGARLQARRDGAALNKPSPFA